MKTLFDSFDLLTKLLTTGIIMDSKLVLSSAQAQTSVATHDSTNVLDFGAADPNTGTGSPLWITVACQTALSGASGTTLQVKVMHATSAAGTYACLFETPVFTNSNFTGTSSIFQAAAGTNLINQPLPAEHRRAIKVSYVIGTTVMASGAWDAYVHQGGA